MKTILASDVNENNVHPLKSTRNTTINTILTSKFKNVIPYFLCDNLLVFHTCVAAILFFCNTMASCVTGFYSYMIQSISCLLFIVYYQKPYFCTWRIHYYMIIFGWIISTFFPIEPIFINQNLIYVYSTIFTTSFIHNYLRLFNSISCDHIYFCLYCSSYLRLLANRTGPVMVIDAPTRILVKRQRKELKILKSIRIQIGIYSIGGIPAIVTTIYSQILAAISIPDELYLLSSASIPIFITFILVVVYKTDWSIRKALILTRCFSFKLHK